MGFELGQRYDHIGFLNELVGLHFFEDLPIFNGKEGELGFFQVNHLIAPIPQLLIPRLSDYFFGIYSDGR